MAFGRQSFSPSCSARTTDVRTPCAKWSAACATSCNDKFVAVAASAAAMSLLSQVDDARGGQMFDSTAWSSQCHDIQSLLAHPLTSYGMSGVIAGTRLADPRDNYLKNQRITRRERSDPNRWCHPRKRPVTCRS